MSRTATFVGFGEAGQAFAFACKRAYDIATDDADSRERKYADYAAAGVAGCDTAKEALSGAFLILSLVTADQALPAARAAAPLLGPGAFWFDLNSVSPATKSEAAATISAAGGRYVDVAVMAPVEPARQAVPLLVAGPDAADGAAFLELLGFSDVTVVGRTVGAASAVKMIRSVMVKGIEALSAECFVAAERAGIRDAVLASLDASWKEQSWSDRADYNLDRMLTHGLRRAAEMEEAARTLEDLGVCASMTRCTIQLQREMGTLGLAAPDGLEGKLAAIHPRRKEQVS